MDYKDYIFLVFILLLMGCTSVPHAQKQVRGSGYRLSFPYYHWAAPIVQDVSIPGHISNGVFIPQHKELVIIKPGEWAQSPAYPIQSKEEAYEHTAHDVDMDVADITQLPDGNGP